MSSLEQDAQHAAQRFGRAPQQLVADRERAQIFAGPSPSCAGGPTGIVSVPVTATGVRSRIVASRLFGTTFTQSLSAAMMRLDVGQRHVLLQLDGQRLAVAAHRADAHAEAVDRDRRRVPKPAPWPRILLVSAPAFHSSRD